METIVTNDLGHRLARNYGGDGAITLGAYRRGNRVPWVPGATIDVWVPCPRSEHVTGVPQPHVYFIQTVGGRTAEDGSIHCPACRVELSVHRTTFTTAPAAHPAPQAALPF